MVNNKDFSFHAFCMLITMLYHR